MISELNIKNVVLPLEDGRDIIVSITPSKMIWQKEEKNHKIIYHPTEFESNYTPKEMLWKLKIARTLIDRTLSNINY